MKQKIIRSERLPKYGTPLRSQFVNMVTKLPGYQEGINKGFPLFTIKELDAFKEHFKDGLTWEEIDKILSGKGIFFKKATFRKYIQENYLSKAIGYKNTKNGRVAIFPKDTISHINFIQYYFKVIDGEHIDNILDMIKNLQITYLDAIESNLSWSSNIYGSIFNYICFDDGDIASAINKALACRQPERDKYLKKLDDIRNKFDKIIRKDIEKLESSLQNEYLGVDEAMTYHEENKDE
ncbi:MAG: hypothetical protein KBA28_10755 [Syntrophaceae bacterium]|nr:hypothetical protein [Syntrophaceae bacterium]HOD62433.1 hypothetical protein [Bacilli bacterium]HOE80436.1 hypothetical protein [Smithellaceae bacterium]HOS15237.1 hypothetical protein [Smithella sp.]HPN87438.1 hypothetical protein [Smithella sp.]